MVTVETSGMEANYQASVVQITEMLQSENFETPDIKAKFVVKELKKRHGQEWACMVEPISTFVQCLGLSKRPDQYIRLSNGTERVRVWRLVYQKSNEEDDALVLKIQSLEIINKELKDSQKLAESQFFEEKQHLNKKLEKYKSEIQKLSEQKTMHVQRIRQMDKEVYSLREIANNYHYQVQLANLKMHEQKRQLVELNQSLDPTTQVFKSMQFIIAALEKEMEAKRHSDEQIIQMVIQRQQQDSIAKSQESEQNLDTKIVRAEDKMKELKATVERKCVDYQDQLVKLNEVYTATQTQLMKEFEHHKQQTLEVTSDQVPLLKEKIGDIVNVLEEINHEHQTVVRNQQKINQELETDFRPQMSEIQKQIGLYQQKQNGYDGLAQKWLQQFEQQTKDTKIPQLSEYKTSDEKLGAESEPVDLNLLSATIDKKISEVITPIRLAVKELSEQNNLTHEQLVEIMAARGKQRPVSFTSHKANSKPRKTLYV